MYKGLKVLVIVPARGGSKGIPKKNILKVGGVPLVQRVGDVLAELNFIDRAIVSTDSNEIGNIAKLSGLEMPFLRPEELSGDMIGDFEVIENVLKNIEKIDETRYDIILMLQPTSPLRRPVEVEECVRRLVYGQHDSVWTVSRTDLKYHPSKQLKIDDVGLMDFYEKNGKHIIARQQLSQCYNRNGVAYAFTRDCIKKHGNITGRKCYGYVLDGERVSIDTMEDVEQVELLLAQYKKMGWSF